MEKSVVVGAGVVGVVDRADTPGVAIGGGGGANTESAMAMDVE
jgi:hypothetical protein